MIASENIPYGRCTIKAIPALAVFPCTRAVLPGRRTGGRDGFKKTSVDSFLVSDGERHGHLRVHYACVAVRTCCRR